MNTVQGLSMLLLAALWGSSFLFMRIATGEFSPIPLIGLRVSIAAIFLLVVLKLKGSWYPLFQHRYKLTMVGLFGSALPFCLIAYALLSITSGLSSVLNVMTPMFTAVIAFLWLKDGLAPSRWLGITIGTIGIVVLVWDKLSFAVEDQLLAIGAMTLATLSYGFMGNYTKRYLAGVDSLVIATGSQLYATLCLLPLIIIFWPDQAVSNLAWGSVIALGVACTGIAYMIFFRLLSEVGAVSSAAVTFLVPVFGITWGMIFLGETVSLRMVIGSGVIIVGTMLASGWIKGTVINKFFET